MISALLSRSSARRIRRPARLARSVFRNAAPPPARTIRSSTETTPDAVSGLARR